MSISGNKWIEVYNSIVLLSFISDEYKNNKANSIDLINNRLNIFCEKYNVPRNNPIYFERGANMLSFCYLIIVRIIEIINKSFKNDSKTRSQFFQYIVETASQHGIKSFVYFSQFFDIQFNTFAYDDNKFKDEEKLYQLFRHMRHSVSHFSYEIDQQDKVHFKSVDPKKHSVELDMEIPMHQLINLTIQFGVWVNNTIDRKKLLS